LLQQENLEYVYNRFLKKTSYKDTRKVAQYDYYLSNLIDLYYYSSALITKFIV